MLWTILLTVLITLCAAILAMNFATPEKKIERKVEHLHAISDPQFKREMSVLLGPSVLAGNHVTDLENGDEIFPAMLEAIRNAEKTITFETYIYWSGEIGREFADALAFAERMTDVFDEDLKPTVRHTHVMWQARPWKEKLMEKFVRPLKSQL